MPKRRPRGEGSVFQRARDSRWVAKLPCRDESGRLKYHSPSFATEAQAKAAWLKHLKGESNPPSRDTLQSFATFWLAEVAPSTRNPKTLSSDRSQLTRHVYPAIGSLRLDQLEPDRLQLLVNRLAKEHPSTAAKVHRVLHRLLAHAVRMRRLRFNPADGVVPPRIPSPEPTILGADACRALLAAARGQSVEGPIRAALFLGLRKGEAIAARWTALDLEASLLTVREQVRRVTGQALAPTPPKGNKVRSVRVPPELAAWLAQQKAAGGSVYLFPGRDGSLYDPNQLNKDFNAAVAQAGLPPMEFRYLRSTWLSWLNRVCEDPAVIMSQAGHSRPDVTFERYVRPFADKALAALTDLERAIG